LRFRGELTVADHELRSTSWSTRTLELPAEVTRVVVRAGVNGAELRECRGEKFQASPWQSQFFHCLREIADLRRDGNGRRHLHLLDFGRTLLTGERVSEVLLDGVTPSLLLMGSIFVLELLVSLALALLATGWHDRWPDRLLTIGSVAGMSISYLVFILLAQYVLAYRWNLFPVWGFASWRNLALPVLVGVISGLGGNVRYYRTVFLNELYRDHVRTARAKGCGPLRLLLVHVLPNALAPVITRVSVLLPFLFTGSLLLESFFGIPGLGYAGINALANGDVQLLKALVLLGGALFIAANLLADLASAAVDPRIRLK
jgi:peptide/nickel transport system permease protein